MLTVFLLAIFVIALAAGGLVWYSAKRWKAREAAEEERMAAFLAATKGNVMPEAPAAMPAAAPAPGPTAPAAAAGPANGLAQQKLLFEAAHKAGEAGEPALAIQLYARLLARYPASSFADQARARVEAEKKKLAKA